MIHRIILSRAFYSLSPFSACNGYKKSQIISYCYYHCDSVTVNNHCDKCTTSTRWHT